MSIQNGKDRIEEIKRAMHRAVDDLFDNHITNGTRVSGFRVTFDCGVDRPLTEDLQIDKYVTGDNHNCLCMVIEKDAENEQDN